MGAMMIQLPCRAMLDDDDDDDDDILLEEIPADWVCKVCSL